MLKILRAIPIQLSCYYYCYRYYFPQEFSPVI